MTVILNASTSQGLVLTSDTSGNVVIQSNGANAITTAGANVTIAGTITATGGVVQGANAAPAFSAYKVTTAQTITTDVFTKVTLNAEEFDTAGCFDSTTNYRFTPTVAGYYHLNGAVNIASTSTLSQVLCAIYKNGASAKNGNYVNATLSTPQIAIVTAVIYLNGTTDYVELWGYAAGGGTLTIAATQVSTYFQGFLARSA